MSDPVEHPDHYTSHPSGVECIEITKHMNFCQGNAVKYIWRAGLKTEDPLQDLRKAAEYLRVEIDRLEKAKTDEGTMFTSVLSQVPNAQGTYYVTKNHLDHVPCRDKCLHEVPNPAFVTVTVTRYEEDSDDPAAPPKQARPWPSAEGADPEAAP